MRLRSRPWRLSVSRRRLTVTDLSYTLQATTMGGGVTGNTTGFGPVIPGSSPGPPAAFLDRGSYA